MSGRRRAAWWWIAGVGALGCQPVEPPPSTASGSEPTNADARGAEAKPEPTPPGATGPSPKPDAVADARKCGEAGSSPTPLPPELVTGLSRIGAGEVGPGETATFGTVTVKYDKGAWIGNRTTGHRGPALDVLVDRAEVGDGPWGHQQDLSPNREFTFHIGPYHFQGRTSMGDPPARVGIEVDRRACPDHAVTDAPRETTWLWVSTDAMRLYTLKRPDQSMLQVGLQAHDETPRLQVTLGLWNHWITPVPGRMPSFRVDDRVVTVEEVVAGAGTRYTDRWVADGVAHAHARVRIEPAEPLPVDPPIASPPGCGEPTAARTELPSALATTPPASKLVRVEVGERKRMGTIELELTTHVIEPPGWKREKEEYRDLQVRGDVPAWPPTLTFSDGSSSQVARVGKLRLRADNEVGGKRIGVRTAELACEREVGIHTLAGPTYVWLSTLGHESLALGAGVHPRLTMQLHADARSPSLGISTEHASYSGTVAPEMVGHAFTMDNHLVEVVDVVAGADTTRETWGWTTTALVPTLHVQVRITPLE